MLLTSKGAAGAAGGDHRADRHPEHMGHVPAISIMLIFGIDKFMSECRALVDFIGDAVAALFVSRWIANFDVDRARRCSPASRYLRWVLTLQRRRGQTTTSSAYRTRAPRGSISTPPRQPGRSGASSGPHRPTGATVTDRLHCIDG